MKAHRSSQGVEESAATRAPTSGSVALGTLGGVALHRLLDALPIALEASTLGGQVLYANRAFETVATRALGDLVGAPAVWTLDERAATEGAAAVRAGVDWVGTIQLRPGEEIDVTLLPLRAQEGGVSGCLCLVRARRCSVPPIRSESAAVSSSPPAWQDAGLTGPLADLSRGDPRLDAYERAAAMLLTVDDLGHIVHANREWLAQSGQALGDLIGRHLDHFLRASGGTGEFSTWSVTPQSKAPFHCVRADGSRIDVSVTTTISAVPMADGIGATRRWVHVQATPIPARSALEASEPPTDQLARVAVGLARDFEHALEVVTSLAELALRRVQPGEPAREAVLRIHEAAQRSSRLVRQVQVLEREDARGGSGDVCELDAVVGGLEGVLRGTMREAGDLRIELGSEAALIRVSRADLELVLVHLVANLREALPAGGTLVLRTRREALDATSAAAFGFGAGAFATLTLGDASASLPPQATLPSRKGAGGLEGAIGTTRLGLATVQSIVRHFGGALSLREGGGACPVFEVLVPLLGNRSSRPPSAPARRGVRILIVDDEAPVRRAVTKLVTSAGFDAIAASDARGALEVLAQDHIDLLLTDVVMPGMSGVELAERVAERHARVAVVYMSGYAHDVISERGIDPSTMLYLQKPFTRLELVRKVELAVGASVKAAPR